MNESPNNVLDTVRMRACAPLLPAPGNEVVCQCLDEIESLRAEVAALRAPVDWEAVGRDSAYDLIDRFMRNNLYDSDYAEYSAALETVYAADQMQALRNSAAQDIGLLKIAVEQRCSQVVCLEKALDALQEKHNAANTRIAELEVAYDNITCYPFTD